MPLENTSRLLRLQEDGDEGHNSQNRLTCDLVLNLELFMAVTWPPANHLGS